MKMLIRQPGTSCHDVSGKRVRATRLIGGLATLWGVYISLALLTFFLF